jgi:hypothetical protein
MLIYNYLKEKNLIENLKEFTHLIYNREIKVDKNFLLDINKDISNIKEIEIGIKKIKLS